MTWLWPLKPTHKMLYDLGGVPNFSRDLVLSRSDEKEELGMTSRFLTRSDTSGRGGVSIRGWVGEVFQAKGLREEILRFRSDNEGSESSNFNKLGFLFVPQADEEKHRICLFFKCSIMSIYSLFLKKGYF